MSDVKPNAQEDKDVEPVSDSPGRTQEPLQSHTFSLKNNAAGLSSDEHENPLNGTQPNPFVYSSVPAVPHAGNSLPSGALVNGPGSHPTSEVHCVLNKGTVLSNNVLDAARQAGKDTSPEVLPPPSELQSDAWKNTAGPAVKTLATQPGVNTPLSHSEENESKPACSALSGADSAEQMHISQPLTKQTMKTRSRRDVEWSESSSDDYDDAEAIRWDSARERSLHNDRRLETEVMHQRDRKHNTHAKSMSGSLEKVNNSLNHTCRRYCFCSGNNVGNVDKDDSLGTQSDIKYSAVPLKDLSRSTASDSEHRIYSAAAQEGCNEENDPEDEDNLSSKVEPSKTEQDPLFFSCTICDVNFKEKRHFHRHMMYHLGKHNQVNSEDVSQPFICRECGRLFCDSNSLMRHIIIHQDRLEKLMEEIKGLKNTELEVGGTTAQCPRCAFGCNCPKISVQHAKTDDNLKHYYFCEECNYITLTQQALEAHLHVAHLDTHQPQCMEVTRNSDAEEAGRVQFQRKMFFFKDKVALERYSELERSHYGNYKKVADQPKIAGFKTNPLKSTRGEKSKRGDIYIQKSNDQTVNSPQLKCRVGCTKNMLSPSLWRVDRHGKLLLQPVEKLDVATDLTCVEEDAENNNYKAFGSSKQANCPAGADFLLSARNLKLDQMFCQVSKNEPASGSLQAQAHQNSLTMRKMSTPLRNTIDNMNGNISARLCQRLKKQSADKESEKGCEGGSNSGDDTSEAAGSFLESENVRNPYARRYFTKRQRFSAKDQSQSPHVLIDEDDGDEDCSDIEQLIIKEEYIETTVCGDSPESPHMSASDSFDVFPTPEVEHKPCPYCPAMFESGVGLSNHVRGHLHRVGLSYSARHMVSPEQVALRDHQPRIRRRIPCGTRKMRKAVKPETKGEHTCPLCWGWFDTKTGLSNHVRGHLKRIGRSVTSTSKSPLCILNELLQDKKEHQNILQVLNKSQFPSRSFVSQKLISGNGLVLMRMGVPVKIQYEMRSPRPILDSFVPKQEAEAFSERKEPQVEAQRGTKASSSTLVELLKMRQEGMELTARTNQEAYATRKLCDLTKDYMEETQMASLEPHWAHGMQSHALGLIAISCLNSFLKVTLQFFNLDHIFPCFVCRLTRIVPVLRESASSGAAAHGLQYGAIGASWNCHLRPLKVLVFAMTASDCYYKCLTTLWKESRSRRRLVLKSGEVTCCRKTTVEYIHVGNASASWAERRVYGYSDFKRLLFERDLDTITNRQDQVNGECDSNTICIQCNGTFPGLPGHLRAFAHRKRIAIFEGYDYKQKKPRPGLKKKTLPSLNAEIYTLTCRFCDLVFQGPLSIQEDWIKHLQRHLLHTSVPHSGTGMVEVLGLHHKIQISMSHENPDLE